MDRVATGQREDSDRGENFLCVYRVLRVGLNGYFDMLVLSLGLNEF